MFDRKSRYAKLEGYEVTDRRGRVVAAVPVPPPPDELRIGDFIRKQGQRLDHLANAFLSDPSGYWRLAELNGAVLPDALAEVDIISIPPRVR